MAFQRVQSLEADNAITIGGYNKQAKKDNPKGVEGFYLGSRVIKGSKYGDSILHVFQTSKGNLGVWGKTNLNNQLGGVVPGQMTRVTYKGMKATKNGDMHEYVVEVDPDNTIEVTASSNQSSGSDTGYSDEGSDDESEDEDSDDGYGGSDEIEDTPAPVATISAAERKAKVDALLAKNKKKA